MLVGVDDDNVIKDFKGVSTCTPNASVVVGTGTYGRHFRTALSGNTPIGVTLAPGFQPKPTANPVGTTFVAFNAGNSRANRGMITQNPIVGPAIYTGDFLSLLVGSGTPSVYGTVDVVGTGAHSVAFGVNGTAGCKLATDGVNDVTGTVNVGNAANTYDTYIGGAPTGGYGGFAADYVWVAHFRKYLSDAEILDLHNSLGASNAFGLIASAGTSASLALTLDAAVFAGTAVVVSPVTATLTTTLESAAFSGTATVTGTAALTLPALKNNTGTLLASESGATAYVYATTGAHVVTKTAQTTNSSGIMTITDAALVAATQYRVVVVLASGAEGMDKVTAA